jgi:hypothetical protein
MQPTEIQNIKVARSRRDLYIYLPLILVGIQIRERDDVTKPCRNAEDLAFASSSYSRVEPGDRNEEPFSDLPSLPVLCALCVYSFSLSLGHYLVQIPRRMSQIETRVCTAKRGSSHTGNKL